MPDRPPFPGRPAQPPGPTFLQYSPDGQRLIVAGIGDFARSFRTNDNEEPDLLPSTRVETLAIASGNDYVILGCEDGTVCEYAVPSGDLKHILVRTGLPVRDVALSPDEQWVAVCSDELEIKVVNRSDLEQITILRDQPKPIKHLTYEPSGKYLAASCTNGVIYIYSMSAEPVLYRTVDGIIPPLENADPATSRCVWHPDGRAFACATATRDIQVVSIEDGAHQRVFSGEHSSAITSLAWSPNGALLASSDSDYLVIWDTKTQKMLRRFNYTDILNIAWQNHGENIFNWTTSGGEVFIIPNFLKEEAHIKLLKGPKVGAPFFHDPLLDRSAAVNGRKPLVNGHAKRAHTPDSLDELLGPEEEFDWIEDDDGAGYINENGKRTNAHMGNGISHIAKRNKQDAWQPQIHEPFQPGATPWRGNRKYLCLNLIGFVWTVDQDTHNTVTAEFYDREMYRDFHFTDPFLYDKACLNETGTLFSSPAKNGQPAVIFYRPHETWTARSDCRISLPDGEEPTCLALSSRYIVAVTNKNYVRVWTLFGTPARLWRMKSSPAVTCAAWGDFVMTVGNGPVGADGSTQLTYSIDNVREDESCQNEDVLALSTVPPDSEAEEVSLKTLFWSDAGDPCIYDSSGVLLTLMHWRTMGQAKWVPLLDTRLLDRLKDGKKEETYWPVAVADNKFHCIILKGGDKSPYFPRPLLTEFDFNIPVCRQLTKKKQPGEDDEEEEENAAVATRLEESYVRSSVLLGLLDDLVQGMGERAGHSQKAELMRREVEVDKILLQLLAVECREGEERGMKALEIVRLLRDPSGKMLEAAAKVAGRWGRTVLEDKIREIAERRLMGLEEEQS
ncbi:chromosome transmission fidelity protein 4 [Cladophialophora yegresii CBS 114405]|uniref:Chromosome transmission fidelity protein 4 n=1 Tax=Cladophialophora yegresii CBS 114405 TaxID=1182544 RepID=W9VYV4_9EURO|nr:chromosome transmission fidelity protein 4 [Cladophialophora yegresii CBS 114405]EXJ61022.1 chromosome transmission fidelity protein 4 [Cladophialophora yegresii CBS 114405]